MKQCGDNHRENDWNNYALRDIQYRYKSNQANEKYCDLQIKWKFQVYNIFLP
jgi:hypothetical protein